MNEWILRFAAPDGTEAIQIRYVEATNKFSVYNSSSGKYGPEFSPGDNPELETNLAKLYVADSVAPTLPGRSSRWRLTVSFKPQAAGRTYTPLFLVSTDAGLVQGYEPLGAVTVTK